MPASPSIEGWLARARERLTLRVPDGWRGLKEPMDLAKRFKRSRKKAEGVAALHADSEGVGLVHVLFPEGERPKLQVCVFAPVAKGQTPAKVAQTLIKSHKLEKAHFVGVLDRSAYVLFPADAPEMPREEWNAAMKWRIKDQIPFPVTQAVVEIFEMPGNSTRIYVAVAKESEVRDAVRLFQGVGVKLTALDIPELALRNLARGLPDDHDGMVVLHLERKSGMVMLIKRGRFYLARRFENGLDTLLQALDEDGGGVTRAPFMDRIALEAQRTMDYFESHFGQAQASSLH
ncbi:MAG: hypothetical protein HQL97_14725, partial [Magnetococcales bacterium]|nr:hypothetical protein [Magnetococcales bacterium]